MQEQAEISYQLLKKYFGYNSFKEGQKEVIDSILNKNDTFAIMPTGAGKSLCYQLSALLFEGTTLVISPLISLMKDQVDALNSIGINATFINSSLSFKEIKQRINKTKNGEYKLLYVAPERLNSKRFYQVLKKLNISLLAIDEAHCVSQWGHDFRPSYRLLAPLIDKLPKRPIVTAFTATATSQVKNDVVQLLDLNNPQIFVTGFDRENLYFSVIKDMNKKDFILDYLKNYEKQSGIIYAGTRKEVDSIYQLLLNQGYKVGRYHAGLTKEERKETQDDFIYEKINIIIATNAFGMGIDKSNIRYVIHHNMPKSIEAYYQEAGRAGRDGEKSECILLFSPGDVQLQKFLIEESSGSEERKKVRYQKLQSMINYCHTTGCLRRHLLKYFGEEKLNSECDNCSNCEQDKELIDITIEAQKIFSCIYHMNQRFGVSLVAKVLAGSQSKRVKELGFDELSTYNIIPDYTIKDIKTLIKMLIAEEYLKLTGGKYPVVKLKENAKSVLNGEEKVYQKIWKPEKTEVGENNDLFNLLRKKRKEISEKEEVPPYIIFHDNTLKEMAKYCPQHKSSLLKISGVGEVKLDKYGESFLNIINKYVKKEGKPEKDISNLSSRNNKFNKKVKTKNKTSSHLVTLRLYQDGNTLEQIAEKRNLTIRTIQNHIIKCGKEDCEIKLDDFIPETQENKILEAADKAGVEKLRPIKEKLADEISYFVIKAVLVKHGLR
ncbi:MAG: DNA helicase RecQ [Bacillota bacterium]